MMCEFRLKPRRRLAGKSPVYDDDKFITLKIKYGGKFFHLPSPSYEGGEELIIDFVEKEKLSTAMIETFLEECGLHGITVFYHVGLEGFWEVCDTEKMLVNLTQKEVTIHCDHQPIEVATCSTRMASLHKILDEPYEVDEGKSSSAEKKKKVVPCCIEVSKKVVPPAIVKSPVKKMASNHCSELERVWNVILQGFEKMKYCLGLPEQKFSSEERMLLFTTIYNAIGQPDPIGGNNAKMLYCKYRDYITDYVVSAVLPSLKDKSDDFFLKDLVKKWFDYKILMNWHSGVFYHLDKYLLIMKKCVPSIKEVGLTIFRDLVLKELKEKINYAVKYLIYREQGMEQSDRALLNDVLVMCDEIGMGQMKLSANDFEATVLNDIKLQFSNLAI